MLRRSVALTLLLLLVLAAPASATITRGWAPGPSPKQVRALARAVKLDDGRVLVAAGSDSMAGLQFSATAEIFDPVTNTWSQASAMHTARWGAVMVKLTGWPSARRRRPVHQRDSLATAEVYDPKTDRWSHRGADERAALRGSGHAAARRNRPGDGWMDEGAGRARRPLSDSTRRATAGRHSW